MLVEEAHMSSYADDTERDSFFAALARVFGEFEQVSKGYGVCDLNRLAEMVGGNFENQVAISRAEDGKIVTTFSDRLDKLVPLPPITDHPKTPDCWAYVPNFTTEPPSMDCIMYLTA
jgi:hypothetical protein